MKPKAKISNAKFKLHLQKDFTHADVTIKDRAPEVKVETNLNWDKPVTSYDHESIHVNSEPRRDNRIVAGSNFDIIVPEVGVIIREESKQKHGMPNFQSKFGRLSVKEYESMKKEYDYRLESIKCIQPSSNNGYNNEIAFGDTLTKEEFHPNKETKMNQVLRHAFKTKHEKIDTRGDLKEMFTNEATSKTKTLPILNENIFKRRKTSDLRSDANMFKAIDHLNSQILQNKNWGDIQSNSSSITMKGSHKRQLGENKFKRTGTRIVRERTKYNLKL